MTTEEPQAIEPDVVDWTWVLHARCPQCGLDAGRVEPASIAGTIGSVVRRWQAVLARPDVAVRPIPTRWSPLEYGAHVSEVHALFLERLALILGQRNPTFADWDQDAAALEHNYAAADPADVARELETNAGQLIALLATIGAHDDSKWGRQGLRSNGSHFTVASLMQYYLHDVEHHLYDVHG